MGHGDNENFSVFFEIDQPVGKSVELAPAQTPHRSSARLLEIQLFALLPL
jgi:hypothetical protein